MEYKRGRYSWLLRPFLIIFDVTIINVLAFYFFNFNQTEIDFFSIDFLNNKHLLYITYSTVFWLVSTSFLKFYEVYRYTSTINIFSLIIKQFVVFTIIVYAFIGAFRSIDVQSYTTLEYLFLSFASITTIKLVSFYGLKSFRSFLRGNVRRVVIIGKGEGAQELKQLFTKRKELGYSIKGVFANSDNHKFTGNIADSFTFLNEGNGIDEIYCAIDELTEKEVNDYVKHAEVNHCNIKFIPATSKLLTKRLKTDYYNYLPILSMPEVALNNDFNKFVKRLFDMVFSLLILLLVLSWLIPILFVIIKLESKGPLFYTHKRNGINYKEFNCHKFRSLKINKVVEGTYITQHDDRVTKIGRFLRTTSLDEFPQFYNVLKGDMSVVGPRPHMLSYTDDYSKKIDKYNFIFRHNVKPGVTGLAQIRGFRGEIKNDQDIINRIKFDNYYIENWSLVLDIKIIFKTIINVFKGQKEAY
ncbi:exopolysaccharide biosynthesis polyprenyl glycosylphosphotransferase [Olleya sp. HaHaR_3_96]|uniref:exopolysaccharide biosynthesis polyprenyl glycosylphosphotransferase n=1 Tax=Olleya sp. HaHaR_3_96 TaxID=2745560 RepID=UPI001C4FECC0|nr:exopolysaccharide biosynthesis polyprenyl glycosylphosphotransferase [Olleya sp. HaHaR_3_96]QXP60679.1 exopolysaccharide biosynthesis polyprenyl glycosylphosphotransferase [Olleya sp. HaHaR_3_96]